MYILIDDILQYSDAPQQLISPALADTYSFQTLTITLDKQREIDCIGVGNTTATNIEINGITVTIPSENGLVSLDTALNTDTVTLTFSSNTPVGRIALGKKRLLSASPAREPGFYSTFTNRTTLTGQVIGGVGGVVGRTIQLDFRYKFDRDIYNDINNAYYSQIGRSYPFFVNFKDCSTDKYPFEYFYGFTDIKWVFQSSANKFLYSKKIKLTEAF